MRHASSVRDTFAFTIAMVVGCSGASPPSTRPSLVTQQAAAPPGVSAAQVAATRQSTANRERRVSWMAPDAKKKDLLYISDVSDNEVTVYSYPPGQLEGTLTGFDVPTGLCSDKAGDVFVTDFEGSEILEYAHGGTTPIATLTDPGQWPSGCSVDPTTGNLAVSNDETPSIGEGNLAIYANARGTPVTYTNPNMFYYFFCSYDNSGNLNVDGFSSTYVTQVAELSKGSASLTSITLNQSIVYPTGIQWDGKYVAIGQQSPEVVFEFQFTGSGGTLEGTTDLTGAQDVVQFSISRTSGGGHSQRTRLIGPDLNGEDVAFFHYPAGGSPSKTITDAVSGPYGSTISRAK
jgi:hypothetical protein